MTRGKVLSVILLDSNIVIYLHDQTFGPSIAVQLQGQSLATCNVVIAEVLGYNQLSQQQTKDFRSFFASLPNSVFDQTITEVVIALRRKYRIQLPDAIIAATALSQNMPLWTHNSADFSMIDGLEVFDPIAA